MNGVGHISRNQSPVILICTSLYTETIKISSQRLSSRDVIDELSCFPVKLKRSVEDGKKTVVRN